MLTHIHGDEGWTYDMCRYHKNEQGHWDPKLTGQKLSCRDYYAYRMHSRDPHGIHDIVEDALTYGGLLKHLFDCDNFIKMEENRLQYLRFHQDKLKAETYAGLADAVAANEHREAGKYIILPSTHTGSPRHNHQNYQDAMATVRKHGKPDLFVTFTCNPKWREVQEALRPGEEAWERNDILARVSKACY